MSMRIDVLEGARIAVTSLRSNRLRTLLTTVGIGIGVATLLAILGIIQGLNASFAGQLASIGANTLYVSKWPWIILDDWWEYRNRKELSLGLMDTIRSQSSYAIAVAPMVGRLADVSFNGRQLSAVQITGSSGDYLQVSGFDLASGRFIGEGDDGNEQPVAVIGQDLVDGLFLGLDPLGHTIVVDNHPFRVVGTLSRKGKFLDNNQDLALVVPFKTFRALLGKKRSMSVAVAIAKADLAKTAEDELIGVVRRERGTPPDKPDDFTINRPEQLAATYQKLTSALYGVAVGVGLITLLVGGIGIMNIMLVSVRERTREIGIRRALGARKRTIVMQFLMEASAVSAVGGVLGTCLGLAAAKLVALVSPLAAAVQPLTVVFGVGFAALVGLLFGIWPAARAANLDPVEALRYE
jgi:putative ABC transport system permease protein